MKTGGTFSSVFMLSRFLIPLFDASVSSVHLKTEFSVFEDEASLVLAT